MKKIFSTLLALCMSLTMGIAGFAEEVELKVSDEEVIKNGTLVNSEGIFADNIGAVFIYK